jgi:hypothetical protein
MLRVAALSSYESRPILDRRAAARLPATIPFGLERT